MNYRSTGFRLKFCYRIHLHVGYLGGGGGGGREQRNCRQTTVIRSQMKENCL